MDAAVRMAGVVRRFGAVTALDGVSITVPRGGIYGLLGPNGAGKTTTIRILLGLIPPDAGGIMTLGQDPRHDPAGVRRRVGVLLEHDGLYEPLSVAQNLEYHARLQGLPLAARSRRTRDVLAAFDLADKARTPAGKLSKGMKRKVAIARALLHEPELVVLDEPTTGLDARAVAALREGLSSIVREHGVTLLVATHNLAEAERLCDRVTVLDAGRVVLEGPPQFIGLTDGGSEATLVASHVSPAVLDAVRAAPGVRSFHQDAGDPARLVLGLAPGAGVAPAVRAAIEAGARIEAVERPRASLEDAFLAATGRPAGEAWQEASA